MQINLMPDLSLLAVMAIFIVEYFVVSRFLVRPVNRVLEEREHDARSAQETYEQSLARFNEATAQIEERLHHARREASQLRDEFRATAATHRAGVLERTTNEASRLIGEAEAKLKQDVTSARDRIVRESESLARLAAERILGRSL
jgi:F-type H+-transporting ATPase subunit b